MKFQVEKTNYLPLFQLILQKKKQKKLLQNSKKSKLVIKTSLKI